MAGNAEGTWNLDSDSGREGWQRLSFLQESSLSNPRLSTLNDSQAPKGLGGK